jgi:modulator of FtsH protease
MNDNVQPFDYGYETSTAQRNLVLRNTYWLLALSLLPTVLGAWVGVATGITAALSGVLGIVVFLGGAFGFIYAIEKTKNSAAGVPVLLAFTFFMGLMLSRMIAMVLGFKNGSDLIMTASAAPPACSSSWPAWPLSSSATSPAWASGSPWAPCC